MPKRTTTTKPLLGPSSVARGQKESYQSSRWKLNEISALKSGKESVFATQTNLDKTDKTFSISRAKKSDEVAPFERPDLIKIGLDSNHLDPEVKKDDHENHKEAITFEQARVPKLPFDPNFSAFSKTSRNGPW